MKSLIASRETKRISKAARMLTSSTRLMPDFLIIGAQKCGTTSLFNYLIQHPHVASPAKKEIHFFNRYYQKGTNWYRSYFPTLFSKLGRQDLLTGEASTGYICHPHAPNRIARELTQVKLIALLRNPVDRAYSHYQHTSRRGIESLSFEDAIAREEERVGGVVATMLKDEYYYDPSEYLYSYLSRGIYVDQIKIWFNHFPKEQILILSSEDLFTNPSIVFKQVLEFLDLPAWEPENYGKYNRDSNKICGEHPEMDVSIRKSLTDYFKPHNERLYEYLGRDFGWNTGDNNAIHRN